MKARQLEQLGIPATLCKQAKWIASAAREVTGMKPNEVRQTLKAIVDDPEAYRDDPHFGELAAKMSLHQRRAAATAEADKPRDQPVPYAQWGEDLEPQSVEQMENACRLPVAAAAALMPDAHLGYGLPIGGVLATENAIVPYAVGVDIACRMKLTVLDIPPKAIESQTERLINAIEAETRFGVGAAFGGHDRGKQKRRQHEVLDADWNVSPITREYKDKARAQLGTSGSGNHFVEFGEFEVDEENAKTLGLADAGTYLALLSHSGSRGTGAAVCSYYSKLAMALHPTLPRELMHLAWLDMDSHEGQEYFAAMNLMGDYAAANHACIHHHIACHLGATVLADIENHHNFAWKETHVIDGAEKELFVHRKGATPAGVGVLGIIPGSMAASCFVVRGKGKAESLDSAAHGAGRVMSRKKAKETFRWSHVRDELKKKKVHVISAGLDENPRVYKDIEKVMSEQTDLVETLARFQPRIVKMAPEGERAED